MRGRELAGAWRPGAKILVWILACCLVAPSVRAQTDPAAAAAEQLGQVGAAFDAVGDRAAAGAWQEADGAYNFALDALDAARPALEAAAGQSAVDAYLRIDGILVDLDVALRAEDPTRVRAAIAGIKSELAPLVPGSGLSPASGDAADTVLAWRDALVAMLALGDSGEWIPMRNATLDLHADILARRDAVAAAAGPEGEAAVERLRIFTMRLFAASLDQSPEDARQAARFYREAIDGLLAALGVQAASPSAPAPEPSGGLRFRAFQVQAPAGQVFSMPLVAEEIPEIGLGGFELVLHWSPTALRLVDVVWETGQGSFSRDDAAGRAELRFPQAPTGPSGRAVLAQLQFDLRSADFDPRDYMPEAEIGQLESALDQARDDIRRAAVPSAASRLTDAYARLLEGRDRSGSLYTLLESMGMAEVLAADLLELIDLASQPSISSETEVPVDLLIQLLGNVERELAAGLQRQDEQLSPSGGIPVTLELISVTDTTGQVIAAQTSPGLVLPPDAGLPGAEALPAEPTIPAELQDGAPAESLDGTRVFTGTPASALDGPTSDESGAEPADTDRGEPSGGRLPWPMIIALGLALLAGGVAVWSAGREPEPEAD